MTRDEKFFEELMNDVSHMTDRDFESLAKEADAFLNAIKEEYKTENREKSFVVSCNGNNITPKTDDSIDPVIGYAISSNYVSSGTAKRDEDYESDEEEKLCQAA
jgi:hypothetical protein